MRLCGAQLGTQQAQKSPKNSKKVSNTPCRNSNTRRGGAGRLAWAGLPPGVLICLIVDGSQRVSMLPECVSNLLIKLNNLLTSLDYAYMILTLA